MNTTQHATSTIRIGPVEVGPGRPAYVIAEAGVNHNGDLDTAVRMARIATDIGAAAIKFQAFRAAALVDPHAPKAVYQGTIRESQQEMLARLELSPEDFARIHEQCRRSEIEFLATPFNPSDVDMLVGLGARALKFASPDIVNEPLLEAGLATGLPLIVSTGAATADEIERTVGWIDRAGARNRLILLHCISAYPVDIESVNLRAIATLRDRYDCLVGFSDHTTSSTIGGLAVTLGASVIEKHFTLGQTQVGPDHAFSLEPAELAQYVHSIRLAERICGNGAIELLDCEREVRTCTRQSIVAARDLPAGHLLTAKDLTTMRPGSGIPPTDRETVLGRRLKQALRCGTQLSWDALD